MGTGRTKSGDPPPETVVAELEGTLLMDPDLFSYFMLMAFEASGLVRFTLLLILWPVVCILGMAGYGDAGLRLAVFVAVAGVKMAEVEAVSRAVLPKFFMEDVRLEAWRVFHFGERRVVVSKFPKVMVERFVKEHLMADEVIGCELVVNRFGYATGLINGASDVVNDERIRAQLGGGRADVGLCRRGNLSPWLRACCKEVVYPPYPAIGLSANDDVVRPIPVIFHDGRLVRRPTPATSLLILLWLPIGIVVCAIRVSVGLMLPMWFIPYFISIFGGEVIVRGRPPLPPTWSNTGVLFVCTHRTLMDPVVLSVVLGRKVPAVTYSISRLSEMLSPIRTVRLTRDRRVDAERIKDELAEGDLVMCPEGTTCREPFLLRFSALFAELSDRIVPVAMNYRVGFFHATTARGWKAMDPIFFFMNPRPVYEVTFLNQLPAEATCSAGKNPYDVANYVQRLLATTLGFECTNYTRKDKYRLLAGNDGNVPSTTTRCVNHLRTFRSVALIH